MSGKCCCGCCLLSTGSTVALVFSGIEAILGILINAELLLLIGDNELTFNPSRLLINIDTIEDFDVFHGIVLAGLGINAFWLGFCIFAVSGNISQSHGRLTPWIFLTYLISMFQFGLTIYFAIEFQSSFSVRQAFYENSVPTQSLTYLALLCIYSGGGIQILLNLFFINVVERRGKEIDNDYSALALYILSHMSRCSQLNDSSQQTLLPEAPPSYDAECPPYLPPQIFQRASESSGSSWSLSCETLKGTRAAAAEPTSLRRSCFAGEHIAALMNRNATAGCQTLNIDTNDVAALPY